MPNMWMIRSKAGTMIPAWKEQQIVSIGWGYLGSLQGASRAAIKERFEKLTSEDEQNAISTWVGIFESFVNRMAVGDYAITYDPQAREYFVSEIKGDYEWWDRNPDPNYFAHIRRVKWISRTIPRDALSQETKNSLGSTLTVFKVSPAGQKEILECLHKADSEKTAPKPNAEALAEQSEDLFENAVETLKDKIAALSPEKMEELTKEILNAMGYVARRTPVGPDRGVDVYASKDGLGLEEPRIFVEVKHREDKQGAPAIRSFLGGRKEGDKCLFVSTGGFTQDAKYEAERSHIPITLIDIDLLAELVIRHYDHFNVDGRSLLPLKKIYIPA